MIKVSVIVPVYKAEKFLKRCVDSLLNQTLRDIEIILVDDGSPDRSGEMADEFSKIDTRIKVIHQKNGGIGLARNAGLDVAEGEYVGFVDSDDYVKADMYENLYNAAKKYDTELVLSGMTFVGGNMFASESDTEKEYFKEDTIFENEGLKTLLLGTVSSLPHEKDDTRYGVSACKSIFSKKVIDDNNFKFCSEREVLSEDAIFMIDFIGFIKRAVGIPGTGYCYVRNGESVSKSYNKERFEKTKVFLKEVEKRLSHIPKVEYRIYLDRLTCAFGRILCAQEIVHAKNEKIKYRDLRKRLKEILESPEISASLKRYPWYRLPKKQAVFAFLMKHRLYFLQKVIVILRDR